MNLPGTLNTAKMGVPEGGKVGVTLDSGLFDLLRAFRPQPLFGENLVNQFCVPRQKKKQVYSGDGTEIPLLSPLEIVARSELLIRDWILSL